MTKKTEITTEQPAMMSSKEIAKLTGKSKSDIHVDIWNMLKQLYGLGKDDGNFHHHKNQKVTVTDGVIACFDNRGYVSEFLLDRRHTEILITGYDVVRRAAVIDRWFKLESGEAQPRVSNQPVQPEFGINPDFSALTQAVAEATASGIMKTILETTGIQATVRVNATVSALPASESAPPAVPQQRISTAEFINTDAEFVPVHKVSWETGLSDPSCRRLVQFANLPSRQLPGVRGLCVHRESFLHAFQVLLEESTPPGGKRKRWQHPEFGGFILRKDPKEIPGEVDA